MQEELERCKNELAAAQQALHAVRRSVLPPSPSTAHTFNPVYATETLEQQVGRCSARHARNLAHCGSSCALRMPKLSDDSCVAWY